jgi:autotransporter-associated beta strand protein
VEVANSAALGTGNLDVSSGAKVRVAGGVTLSNALAVATGQARLAGGTNSTDVSTITGAITGGGGIEKTGAGRLVLIGTNTYSGATDVSEGKLVVSGDISSSSKTTVASGGTLGGSGKVGALEVASGGTLAVGNSPGTLNAGNTTWAGGATLEWEVDNFNGNHLGAGGSALTGQGTNWDFLNIASGTLNITATSTNKFIIDVISLLQTSSNPDTWTNSGAEYFNPLLDYSFAIATAAEGILIEGTGLSGGLYSNDLSAFNAALAGLFQFETANFANAPMSGSGLGGSNLWSISTSAGGTTLLLNYTAGATAIPEPNSASLVLLGLGIAYLRRRRRG